MASRGEPARVLKDSLRDPRRPLTIADAAAASGLPLRDAERGLHELTAEYRGHLRVTDQGELLFVFPYGFAQPWKTRDAITRALEATLRVLAGLGRFVVRAWVTIVLVGYVALFVALLVAMAASRSEDRRRHHGSGMLGYAVFRMLGDALFWTFHPFSPIGARNVRRFGAREPRDETPFYEKVNRFVFGPTLARKDDEAARTKRIVNEIRAQQGRIGLADVMRVTGLPREEADPLMARLMVDFDGDVAVSEDGGIIYRFPSLRRTADGVVTASARSEPAWERAPRVPPLTGNPGGSNFLIAALNAFNLLMSSVALAGGWTLERLVAALGGVPVEKLPPPGTAWVLGVIPLVFSLVLFALPIARALWRPIVARRIARERARLAVLREVLTRVERREDVRDEPLIAAWQRAAGRPPAPEEITRAVVRLGGDVEVSDSGAIRYRFADLETEAAALAEEREAAPGDEVQPGRVVFATDRD